VIATHVRIVHGSNTPSSRCSPAGSAYPGSHRKRLCVSGQTTCRARKAGCNSPATAKSSVVVSATSRYGQLDSIGDDFALADAGVVQVFVFVCFDCFEAAAQVVST
jgi:hypothetical protein